MIFNRPLMIALVALLGLLALSGWLLKNQIEHNGELQSNLNTLQSALLTSERNNSELRAEIKRLDGIVTRNARQKLAIKQQLTETFAELAKLQDKADVKEWSDQRHPDDITELLRGSRHDNGNSIPETTEQPDKPLPGDRVHRGDESGAGAVHSQAANRPTIM